MSRFVSLLIVLSLLACGNNEQAAPSKTPVAGSDTVTTNPTVAPPPEENAQSVATLEAQHRLVPSDPAIAYDLAYAYAEEKNSMALRLADSLIKQKAPEPEKAYYSKAEYYSRTGSTAEALKAYDAAIAANLYFLDAHIDKGQLLFKQQRFEEALKTFAIGQKVSVSEPLFYLWIAKTQEAMGSREDAKLNYERALALDKTLTEAEDAVKRLE